MISLIFSELVNVTHRTWPRETPYYLKKTIRQARLIPSLLSNKMKGQLKIESLVEDSGDTLGISQTKDNVRLLTGLMPKLYLRMHIRILKWFTVFSLKYRHPLYSGSCRTHDETSTFERFNKYKSGVCCREDTVSSIQRTWESFVRNSIMILSAMSIL